MRSTRARILALLAASTLLALAGCGGDADVPASSGSAPEVTNVRMALSFAPNGLMAGLMSGIERGEFEDEDIHLEVQLPSSTSDSLKLLAAGSTDIAIASSLDVIVARSQDLPINSVGVMLQDTGSGYMTRSEDGIDSLSQFEGLTVGMTGQVGPAAVFKRMLAEDGVDLSKVKFVNVGFTGIQALYEKQVDALGDTTSYQTFQYNALAGKPADDRSQFDFTSFRDTSAIKLYGASITTSDSFLADQPDVVSRFLKAFQESLQWGIDNPEDAAELEVEAYPDLDVATATSQWKAATDLVQSDDTEANGLLWQNLDVFEALSAFLDDEEISGQLVDVSAMVTNDYLEAS